MVRQRLRVRGGSRRPALDPSAVNPAFSGVSRVRNRRGGVRQGASCRRLGLDIDTPTSSRRDVTVQKPNESGAACHVCSLKMPTLPAGACFAGPLENDILNTAFG